MTGPVSTRGPAPARLSSSRLWITVIAGLLCAGCLLGAAGTWVEQRQQAPVQTLLRLHLRPAEVQVEQLKQAYADQETGLRGFLLTGRQAELAPYVEGQQRVEVLQTSLRSLLRDEPEALALLTAAAATGSRWTSSVADPQVAARGRGPISRHLVVPLVELGHQVFDRLRRDVDSLSDSIDALISSALVRFDSAQGTVRGLQLASLLLAAVGALALGLVLWQMGSRPLRRLVAGVEAVADGDYTREVPQGGPQEWAKVGRAVERMRTRLLRHSADAGRLERSVAVLEERERVAGDLHDLTIQRVFALGLRLSSLAASGNPTPVQLHAMVVETDAIICELRQVIHALGQRERPGLGAELEALLADSEDLLGFRPTLVVSGELDDVPDDVQRDLVAVVGEAVSNVVRHARAGRLVVGVHVDPPEVVLLVEDDGCGRARGAVPGLGSRTTAERARRHHGAVSTSTPQGGGTTLRWTARWEAVTSAATPPVDRPAASGALAEV